MRWRYAIQIFFFVLIGLISANISLSRVGIQIPLLSSASINAIRPFGAIHTLHTFLSEGLFAHNNVQFVLMFIVFFLALLFGPLLCGWICPLGTFQEWVGKAGRKIFRKKYNHFVPQRADKSLRYGRYIVLLWVFYVIINTGRLRSAPYDPYNALFNFWTGEVAAGALIILGTVVLLSLAMERPWCKYACPLGALLGLSNLIKIFPLKRKAPSCISCKVCDKTCPMNIQVSTSTTVRNHQCISCYECTSERACPVAGTVVIERGKSGVSIKNSVAAVLVFVVILGGIALTIMFNPSANTPGIGSEKTAYGDIIRNYSPDNIKGAATLGLTSRQFGVPLDELAYAFRIPPDVAENFRHSLIEEVYIKILGSKDIEIGNGSIKLFIALYTGLPYEVTEPTYLLEEGVNILKEKGSLTDEQLAYIEQHQVSVPADTEKYFRQFAAEQPPPVWKSQAAQHLGTC